MNDTIPLSSVVIAKPRMMLSTTRIWRKRGVPPDSLFINPMPSMFQKIVERPEPEFSLAEQKDRRHLRFAYAYV